MEHMTTPVLSGLMVRLRNRKGFSLIEMAIVLVVIGIIIAAILKGQDLLFNSRTKQFVSTANAWKVAAYAFMDRNNRFPGDEGMNGNIGDQTSEQGAGQTAIDEVASGLSNVPPNPVVIGGQSYWFYFGSMVSATNQGLRNIMVICPSVGCTTGLSPDDVAMFSALDISLDGTADAGIGSLRGIIGSGFLTTVANSVGGRANGYVSAASDIGFVTTGTVSGTSVAWTTGGAATQYGGVWAFDKKF